MYTGIKVLDLSGHQGYFCTYILAHLDCEVIVVEPPGGLNLRSLAPLHEGESAWWQAYGRGKKSLILDIHSQREQLLRLIRAADVLVHNYTASMQAELGLTYESLEAINPGLVVTAITPFGATGPKADWPASDLTVWAASGAHYLSGDSDRAPVRTSIPQAFAHAGADAAGATLIALWERSRSGCGQLVDISAQVSSAQAALAANLAYPNNAGYEVERVAGGLKGLFPVKMTWPCKDGYVAITLLFGPSFDEPNRRILTWCMEEGHCTQEDVDTQWGQELMAMMSEQKPPDAYFELCKKIEGLTLSKTQQELFEEGNKRGLYIAPTYDIAGLMTEEHFKARGYWTEVDTQKGTVTAPGAFAKLSETPIRPPPAAPALGSQSETAFNAPATELSGGEHPERPLEGLKILDFMWVIAGPFFTRVLANYGATVIKVESSVRLEPARGTPVFKNGEPGIETSVPYSNFNTDKLSFTIDPSNEMGRQVLLDLVKWADVVTESFSPKAMAGWGLDYDSLKRVNPEIIMLSSCLMGQTGPRAKVAGYGNMAAALSGFYDLTGWQDRSPAGPYLAYTDGVAPRFMLTSLMAALEHRRKTGQGQRVDLSQAEAAIHLLAPGIFDLGFSGRVWHRAGNRDLQYAPHGVFPVRPKGNNAEGWIAIAVTSDDQWRSLCAVLDLDQDPGMSREDRLAAEDLLETAITKATQDRDAETLEAELIAAAIPAHLVLNSQDAQADPQFQHRNHFIEVPHTPTGSFYVENTRFRLSRTPGRVDRAGPEMGEHNFHVLKEILNYDDDHIADIYASLAIE